MTMKRAWRYSRSTGYWYWGDDKYDHGHVFRTVDGEYGASTARGFATMKLLRDAKEYVERNAS